MVCETRQLWCVNLLVDFQNSTRFLWIPINSFDISRSPRSHATQIDSFASDLKSATNLVAKRDSCEPGNSFCGNQGCQIQIIYPHQAQGLALFPLVNQRVFLLSLTGTYSTLCMDRRYLLTWKGWRSSPQSCCRRCAQSCGCSTALCTSWDQKPVGNEVK